MTLPNPRATGASLVALGLLAGLSACGQGATESAARGSASPSTTGRQASGTPAAHYPMRVSDCDAEVTIEKAPTKVMTVGSAAISLLDAAGAADRIVARAGEFGAALPDGLRNPPTKATIVDPADPSTEAILKADVDAVYGYGLFKAKREDLTKAGMALLTVNGDCGHDAGDAGPGATLADVARDIRRLGTVFGTSTTAEASAAAFEAEASKLSTGTAGRGSAAWVYYFGPKDPVSAYGRKGIPADVLTKAGLTNVFADQAKPFIETNMEALLAKDPEWIVLSYGLYGESAADAMKKFRSEKGASQLKAVSKNRIVVVPGGASQPSPAALDGLRAIVKGTSPS